MNKNKGKRGGRSSRGTSRAGNPGRQQAKAAAAPEAAQHEAVMDTTAATPPPPSAGGEYAQQVDENGKQVGKYKTKLCVFNASPQGCPYGTECLFAHGTFAACACSRSLRMTGKLSVEGSQANTFVYPFGVSPIVRLLCRFRRLHGLTLWCTTVWRLSSSSRKATARQIDSIAYLCLEKVLYNYFHAHIVTLQVRMSFALISLDAKRQAALFSKIRCTKPSFACTGQQVGASSVHIHPVAFLHMVCMSCGPLVLAQMVPMAVHPQALHRQLLTPGMRIQRLPPKQLAVL